MIVAAVVKTAITKRNVEEIDKKIDSHEKSIISCSPYWAWKHVADRMKLAKKRLANIVKKGCDVGNDYFVFLTGAAYYEFMLSGREKALPIALQHYSTPFSEHQLKGIGDILHFLKNNK